MPLNKENSKTTTDLVSEAKKSIDLITNSAKSLMIKKKELEDSLNTVNNRIKELFEMPLNIDDYCSYIPYFVKACGKATRDVVCARKEITWQHCENEKGEMLENKRLVQNAEGFSFGDLGLITFHRECFYNPESVIKQLTETLKEKHNNWGNDEYPSVTERRIEVKQLVSKREEIQEELNIINADINKIRDELIGINLIEIKKDENNDSNEDVYDYLRHQGFIVKNS